jgi:hypothetical protein
MITRRTFIKTGLVLSGDLAVPVWARGRDQTPRALPNGIVIPERWPPRYEFRREPTTPPYLASPPAVVPVDIGRQLFVDDFLVESTTLVRTFHTPEIHAEPILVPERPWERLEPGASRTNPTAAVFSDAVLWDDADRVFKMWYMGGYTGGTCYATSTDGLRWVKPRLDVVSGTNVVNPTPRDSSTVWLDRRAPRAARFKMACSVPGVGVTRQRRFISPDGIHWTADRDTPPVGDRTTFFYNPFRDRWVFSIRAGGDVGGPPRHRRYVEVARFESTEWTEGDTAYWIAADDLDPRREDLKSAAELYNLDCVAYESLIIGLFSIWRGEGPAQHKHVDICLGFSRDGFHWTRYDRQPFIAPAQQPGGWNRTNVQSAGGCCVIADPRLYFYFSGRSGSPNSNDPGISSTGVAMLRRDGFASMAAGEREGQVTTRPLSFSGKHLFVNADCSRGELRAELLDRDNRVVRGFSREDCRPVRGDSTRALVSWNGSADVSRLSSAPVRIRFFLKGGRLYAFWIAPDLRGASRGYLGMGGPDL